MLGAFLCFYTEAWNLRSDYLLILAYLCAFFLCCYVCEGCWHVALNFKKKNKGQQQSKIVFFMAIWIFFLVGTVFYMNKISETLSGDNLFLIFALEFIIVLITACFKEKSLLFMVNILSIIGLTTIFRSWLVNFYSSSLSLSTLNIPFESIPFLLVGVDGRNKEKQIQRKQVKEIKDRIMEAVILLFIYCLMTKRYPLFQHLLFIVGLYYLIRTI